MTWLGFTCVFVLFFATHSIPVRPAIRSRIVAVLGSTGFSLAYSILSIGMLSLLIWSAGKAPYVELWPQMNWQRHVVHVGMLAVCMILAFTVARPNPFSFGGAHNQTFDPKRPGIVRLARHPVLLALALWAGLHLLPNGDLAHALLFGILGSFAIAGQKLINRRKKREMGEETWDALTSIVAKTPIFHAPLSWIGAIVRLCIGLLAFAALLALHPIIVGVSAL